MSGCVAEPLYFGREERPLFGWLHRPKEAGAPAVGVVICNPFGYEGVCAHRALRHFADSAADSGLPAIRFDYDGTGDSAGTEFEPGRVDAWVASVGAAIAALKDATGVGRVILIGVRLGATLAALAASGRVDVAGLVAIAPVVSGRAFLREAAALQGAHAGQGLERGGEVDDGLREVLGVPITPETWDAIGRIDLMGMPTAPAPEMLILDRITLGRAGPWAQRLRELGARVEDHRVAGYEQMVLDSHDAEVPEEMLRLVRIWFARVAVAGTSDRSARPDQACTAPVGAATRTEAMFSVLDEHVPAVVERVLWLDGGRRIFGILSESPSAPLGGDAKGILLINNGAVHHVGPSRLHVTLARRWAAAGHAVLRIDLPGIGDSRPYDGEPENVVYSATAVDGVDTAVRWLRSRYPGRECHGMGICSGGYHALKAAVAGVPLDGIVVINPLTFFWKPGMSLDYQPFQLENDATRYKKSLLSPKSWKKFLRGQVRVMPFAQVVVRRTVGVLRLRTRNIGRELGFRLTDDLGRELAGLAHRGVRIRFIFADSDPGFGLLKQNAGWVLGRLLRRGQVQLQIVRNANHSFTHRGPRGELIQLLTAFVQGGHCDTRGGGREA